MAKKKPDTCRQAGRLCITILIVGKELSSWNVQKYLSGYIRDKASD